jgi:hypothetical protein
MNPKEDVTKTYLNPDRPYHNELEPITGEWRRTAIEVGQRTIVEFPVAGAFDEDNPIRRKLPDGRVIRQAVWRRYEMDPGQVYEIPTVHMPALRREECKHPECGQSPLTCTTPEHAPHRLVVGGLAPFCRVVGEVQTPKTHPAIRDEQPAPAAETPISTAINPPPVLTAEARALERARARRAGGAK